MEGFFSSPLYIRWLLYKLEQCINPTIHIMKGKDINAQNGKISLSTNRQFMMVKKYICRECEYRATPKCYLIQPQQAFHKDQKYLARNVSRSLPLLKNIRKHQQSKHVDKRYSCIECHHQVTSKASLSKHEPLKEMGRSSHIQNAYIRLL